MEEFLFTDDSGIKLAANDGCSVYQLRNETGEGTITIYEVFPGVILSYNDFHIRYYDSEFKPDRKIFCIDHCSGAWRRFYRTYFRRTVCGAGKDQGGATVLCPAYG